VDSFGSFGRRILHLVVVWLVDTASLLLTALLLPGINLPGESAGERLVAATAAALVLGVVNFTLRPIVLLLSLPFGYIAVFAMGLVVNALVLLATSWLLPALEVANILWAFVGGLVFALVNTVVTNALSIDDEDSFYRRRLINHASRTAHPDAHSGTAGLLMIEIDGLSYWHMHKALDDGWMPNLKQWIDEDGYVLSRADCGLPSQTSACQAGILFGDNHDIPAFRWYDKTEQRVIVSKTDAPLLNQRHSHGAGLLRGGSSISNMLNGDAQKSLLTLANITAGSDEEKKARAADIYLLMLDPYFLMRTLVLFFVDAGRDLWEGWQQKRQNVYPRLDRTKHWYPFVRAAVVTFLREVAANLLILDIARGSPAIYTTYAGYDEVAHHSGPWTTDAFKVLQKFDRKVARLRAAAEAHAPRPYTIVLLSDHGQSSGPTFKMRYGKDIKQVIEELMPQGTTVSAQMGGDTGVTAVAALGDELANLQESGVGSAAGRTMAKQGHKWAERAAEEEDAAQGQNGGAPAGRAAQVVAYGSGNIAQVYFTDFPHKLTVEQVEAAFPNLVDSLVRHEGVGLLVVNEADGTATAIGKGGRRNLHTGQVVGTDPLLPYAKEGIATADLRAEQLRRVADFPHAGDLMVNSTLYEDGTVAALEELIGNHGGLGGEQTDAFILHPGAWEVPPTKNSADFFAILDAQRGRPAGAASVQLPADGAAGATPAAPAGGLGQARVWLSRAARCLVLDPGAYREVAFDPAMNAPALLIGALLTAFASGAVAREWSAAGVAGALLTWLASLVAVHFAARLLKGTGTFSATLRVVGFAQVGNLLYLLALLPGMSGAAALAALAVVVLGIWIGTAQAHRLEGWRTLLLPVAVVVTAIVVVAVVRLLLSGAALSLESLLESFGLVQAQ
jgi:uncharacterized membrane protein YvlD (DUF360 family)